jgi:hypothetical protein
MLYHETPFYTTFRRKDIIESRIRSGLNKYYRKSITNDMKPLCALCIVQDTLHNTDEETSHSQFTLMRLIVELYKKVPGEYNAYGVST